MNYGKMNINMEHKKKIRDGFNPKASILFFSSLPPYLPFPSPLTPLMPSSFPFPFWPVLVKLHTSLNQVHPLRSRFGLNLSLQI